MHPAHAMTVFFYVYAARSIVDNASKTRTRLTLGGCRFGFCYSLLWHHIARTGLPTLPSCYMVASFLLLDVTVSCELMYVTCPKLPDNYYAVFSLISVT